MNKPRIEKLRELQSLIADELPSYDPEDTRSTLGKDQMVEAISSLGDAINQILCADEYTP